MQTAGCRLSVLFSLFIIFGAALAGAKAPSAKAQPAKAKGLDAKQLADELRKLADAPALRRANSAIAVMDLSTGEWLFTHNPDQPLVVASNNKLATTAAALELLGPDFEFTTTVYANGKLLANGVLDGDLVVTGRGDPSISGRFHQGKSTAVMEQWAEAVAKAGIRKVQGGIIADDTYFDRQHLHPDWPQGQFQAWYCAPVSALSFNDNCVFLTVRPAARQGDVAIASTAPPTSYVTLVTTCRTSRARLGNNRVLVSRRMGDNRITISGDVRHQGAPFHTWLTVHEPALYAATVFAEVLEAKGIQVGGQVRLLAPPLRIDPAAREIITTTSSLKDAVTVANRNSQNFYAEQILKTLAREKAGKGTWPAGAGVVRKFLADAGVTGNFTYTDGSGLARSNRFTARQVVQLLHYANSRRWVAIYRSSLAEPGEEGTLSRRLAVLKGHLYAKTGYISGASALSGYLDTRGARLVAFAILVNDFRLSLADVRAAQDALCLKLSEYGP